MVSKKEEEEIDHFNYVLYVELNDLTDDEKQESVFNVVINSLIEVNRWNINFDALIFLRRLNKYHNNIVHQILPKITKSLTKLSNSIRSVIVIETLMFITELFDHYQISKENQENDIKGIVPFVSIALHSVFNSKKFIREQGKQTLTNSLVNNNTFGNFAFCSEIIDQMKNDKPIISDTAFDLYQHLITKITSYASVTTAQWIICFGNIDALYSKKREIYEKKAVKILKDLQDKITIEKFNQKLKECGLEKNIELYDSWIKLREKKTNTRMSVSDFKKEMQQKKEEEEKDKNSTEDYICTK